MYVRSTKITAQDVRHAVSLVPAVIIIDGVREFTPRRHYTHGCQFYLGGVGMRHRRASAHDPDWMAATWTDWGIVINRLYQIDPDAQIGYYKNYDHFMTETARQQPLRKELAPWLQTA